MQKFIHIPENQACELFKLSKDLRIAIRGFHIRTDYCSICDVFKRCVKENIPYQVDVFDTGALLLIIYEWNEK